MSNKNLQKKSEDDNFFKNLLTGIAEDIGPMIAPILVDLIKKTYIDPMKDQDLRILLTNSLQLIEKSVEIYTDGNPENLKQMKQLAVSFGTGEAAIAFTSEKIDDVIELLPVEPIKEDLLNFAELIPRYQRNVGDDNPENKKQLLNDLEVYMNTQFPSLVKNGVSWIFEASGLERHGMIVKLLLAQGVAALPKYDFDGDGIKSLELK